MPDITDPSHIDFAKLCRRAGEELLRLHYLLTDLESLWAAGADQIPNGAGDIVQDGRQGQALNELAGANIHALLGSIGSILAITGTAPAQNLLNQLRIRDISVIV